MLVTFTLSFNNYIWKSVKWWFFDNRFSYPSWWVQSFCFISRYVYWLVRNCLYHWWLQDRDFSLKKGSSDPMPFPPGVGGRGVTAENVHSYEVITADKAIDENNVGNRMLRNMGWQEGLVSFLSFALKWYRPLILYASSASCNWNALKCILGDTLYLKLVYIWKYFMFLWSLSVEWQTVGQLALFLRNYEILTFYYGCFVFLALGTCYMKRD